MTWQGWSYMHLQNGMINRGNWNRIKKLMRRAASGEAITIGFIGGSITQGSLASISENCYAYRVFSWWKETFPQSDFSYVNAGIGATTSQFAVARVERDLLDYAPDFVIVEFSVNDENEEHFLETYEGLVRKIYGSAVHPAVVLVHNVFYDTGESAQEYHSRVGCHYGLPCLSMKSSIYSEVVSEKLDRREITPDGLHPNDAGHALVASVISSFLEQVFSEMDRDEAEFEIPAPLTENAYENSRRYQNNNFTPVGDGHIVYMSPQEDITDCFKNGWMMRELGAHLEFDLAGSCFAVQYRRSVNKPAPVAIAYLDNDRSHAVTLDANFDEDWGDKAELATIAEHIPFGRHKVTVEIVKTNDALAELFYLISVIASGKSYP